MKPGIGYGNLLFWLFVYLTVAPFFAASPIAPFVVNVLFSILLFSTVFIIHWGEKNRLLWIFVLSLMLIPLWLSFYQLTTFPTEATHLMLVLYLAIAVCSLLMQFFRTEKVTLNMVCAAFCLYLLAGICAGVVFAFVDFLLPGSFAGDLLSQASPPGVRLHGFIYFSFTTLTTLGYGDIVPQTAGASALCQAEAILGQFFISGLVAQLIGIRVAQRIADKTN